MLKRGTRVWVLVPDPGEMLEGTSLRKLSNGNYLVKLDNVKKYQEIESKYIFLPGKTTGWLVDRIADVESEHKSDPDCTWNVKEFIEYSMHCTLNNSDHVDDWDETAYHGITHTWYEFE